MTSHHLLVLGNPAARHLKLLSRLPAGTSVTVTSDAGVAAAQATRTTAVLCDMGQADVLEGLLGQAPQLRWVHSLSAGVETLLFPGLLAHPLTLTNGRGMFKRSLAEFVIAGCLFFAKDMRRLRASQAKGAWDPFYMQELHGRTLAIVGYGEIGRAAAGLAKAFGMRVLAYRRRPELSRADPLVDRVYGHGELAEMIAQADYLCAAAPNVPSATGLIGAPEFAAMKPGAVIINVGRGPTIVESELIAALQSGRIRGAALDVFDTEPLPAGHPLYSLDNVLMSPHCADRVEGWLDTAMGVFLENFDHFVAGRPLVNVVDKQAGY
jgi:phosphoglycerate dehydrogenase-like enzyme